MKSTLHLDEQVPVRRIIRWDSGSMASPLRAIVKLKKATILDQLEVKSDFAKRQTMNVDIDVEDD